MLSLTNKEKTICEMVSVGMTNQEISQQLQRSIHTINTHIKNIFQKNKISNRTQLCYLFSKYNNERHASLK
ncbi:helix-turn-helix transcriptional regulator [Escherichia coli]|uniref:helix-turn-helix transcriptional regulator n=1 Tax=Escherichia coli TaxID=562 RepID=UPI000DA44BE5|nr:helix-turn-helix transcriptional regulator [Salmonella enterica]EEU9451546.1 helix-turn-helix transcriptional regulator [Escherichia coli]EHF4692778.1 helix-turn-helix transcriptional regulator [Salmonella enterica subsp. enterica serovar Muenchen]EFK8287378.1 helix-turn-helix transcriptional regulator [Escherichia coli]EFK8681153.1 helix-turn-helix transcriptional regulator [Escherichia coli]